MSHRQIVLDTETTGLETSQGHRIIEIGCVELIERKHTRQHFHQYINPQRAVDEGALEVHGISNEYLADKPLFSSIVDEFIEFVRGAELIIHNAQFDLGFIDYELALVKHKVKSITDICSVVDTLGMARKKHPGQKNNLDALCKRYTVDNANRTLHGALLDSEILADVYLRMTGGQTALLLDAEQEGDGANPKNRKKIATLDKNRKPLTVIETTKTEREEHYNLLTRIDSSSEAGCLWLEQEAME